MHRRTSHAFAAVAAVAAGLFVGFAVRAANEIDPTLQSQIRADLDAAQTANVQARSALATSEAALSAALAKLNTATPITGTTTTTGTTPTTPPAAADFYVSPTGSDNAAGTEAAPWATVSKALASATPGATVYVRAGTYAANQLASGQGNIVRNNTANFAGAFATRSGLAYSANTIIP